MKISAKISSLALVAVMALSGTAVAQTMVAGMSVSAEDLPKVQAQCDALADAKNNNSTAAATTEDTAKSNDDASTDEDAAEVSGTAEATTAIDLEILTYENCKEAGLVK